jgi:hypothetical protein
MEKMFSVQNCTEKTGVVGEVFTNGNLHLKTGSRGKIPYAARELVFGVNNPAVFLRKILGLFSMAKRQNSSRQHKIFSHSASF